MAKYVYAYRGGSAPTTDAEREAAFAAWGAWFEGIGAATIDTGNPFSVSSTVSADGSVAPAGGAGLGGYSIVSAESLDAATEVAKGCPVLAGGGTVDVYEVLELM